MKKFIMVFIAVSIFFLSFFAVRYSIAQENVQQVLDIACIAKDVASYKDCIQQVQDGNTDFIKITEMIECKSQNDCAIRLSDIKRTVLIYGATNTGSGFRRIHEFNYSLFTLQNSEKISIGSFLIDDSSEPLCPTGTVCPPLITIQNSNKILVESLITKASKNTAIFVQGGKDTIIKKSIFDGSEKYALEIQNASDTLLESNIFKNSFSNGVVFSSQGKNTIVGNTFIHNNTASFTPGCGSVCNGAQLHILAGTGIMSITKNIIKDGYVEDYSGFGLTASGVEIAGENIEKVEMSCNTIVNNSGNGIIQTKRTSSLGKMEITKNTLRRNGIDMNVIPASSDVIEKNCFDTSCRVEGC